ncbi:short-chain dehydrogenase/reductase SDR [Verticillium alfalfae VaMs.102]|uniref:Short-chain dehydrogenase/reductase SDR n=1 Tax=Verticillium alfalfae (strain VaMs.102 / ATCC MYA-4576 / FGSC 10136) TaxID=526221 RepID=C9S735_VERA1|nr:short-chain dehydrogenase/reductase SDR [Verticillium alfalfae VaMs.102]EEY15212.1 short-chain dehydrogenase/reductase SDR [Verticillium alfalfae VaMs.102]
MSPQGFAIIIGAGPTSGAGIARVLASPDHGNLAVALLARNPDNLSSLCSDLRKTSQGVFQPFPTDTGADNLRRTFKQIAEHDNFKDLKLKLAVYHVKHSSKKPFLEETAEAFTDSMQTYTTGAFVFAQEALKLFYAQNGGQTLLSETNGEKKGTIIFTGTLGAMRANVGFAAYGATRARRGWCRRPWPRSTASLACSACMLLRTAASSMQIMRTLARPSSLWVHELGLRPAQEAF